MTERTTHLPGCEWFLPSGSCDCGLAEHNPVRTFEDDLVERYPTLDIHTWRMTVRAVEKKPDGVPEETLQAIADIIEEHQRALWKALRPYNKFVTTTTVGGPCPTRFKALHGLG